MKILLTGFSGRQNGTVQPRFDKYITFPFILKQMFARMRELYPNETWELEHRPVEWGESLEQYDLTLIGCSNPNAMTGIGGRYGAYWAMLAAPKKVFWFDDWRLREQFSHWVANPEIALSTRLLPAKMDSIHDKALADGAEERLAAEFKAIQMDGATFISQLFRWGDESKFRAEVPESRQLIRIDPSAFVPAYVGEVPVVEKQRTWLVASLTQFDDYLAKLKPTWPVDKFAKPKGMGGFGGGWKKKNEVDLVKEDFAKSWGTISRPYSHAGSGWWRARFNYAVMTGTIMVADRKEVAALGEIYDVDVQAVEQTSSDSALLYTADLQRAAFMSYVDGDREVQLLRLGLLEVMDRDGKQRIFTIERDFVDADHIVVATGVSTEKLIEMLQPKPAKVSKLVPTTTYSMRKLMGVEMETRDGTLDAFVVNEVKTYIPLDITSRDTVFDIGGNIGAFTVLALQTGAKRCIAFEPDPENCDIFARNTKQYGDKVSLFRGAVMPDDSPDQVSLFVNGRKNKGTHTVFETRGRDSIPVSVAHWSDVLQQMADVEGPVVAKIDIEGGEYGLDLSKLPSNVRALAIEFHLTRQDWRETQAPRMYDTITNQRFVPTVSVSDTSGQRWTSFYIFHREALHVAK